MDVFFAFTYGSAAWLTLQALPLVVMPKVIIGMLTNEVHQATDTEIYFSRSFGFSLILIAIIGLFFTGAIPIASSVSEPVSLADNDPKAPYALPIVRVTAMFHTTCLIYSYMRWVDCRQTGYMLGAIGSGVMAAIGVWLLIFGTTPGHFSKRTGADKRTAGFPFSNASAYDRKKDKKLG